MSQVDDQKVISEDLNPPPMFAFSPLQQHMLLQIAQAYAANLLSFRFNEPEKDTLLLRQHAALSGSLEAVQNLISLDARNMAEYEERMRRNTPADSAATGTTTTALPF